MVRLTTDTTKPLLLGQAREVAADIDGFAEAIGIPYEAWAARCHEISLKILRTGRFGPGRIARGWAPGIFGQHSWIVLGDDVYDPDAIIVDPTYGLWLKEDHPVIYVYRAHNLAHRPHGVGVIWHGHDMPSGHGQEPIDLTPSKRLSPSAKAFLTTLGPLDIHGWLELANGPMQGWPAREIIAAMDDTVALRALVPIDILGMVTDRNPGGGYR